MAIYVGDVSIDPGAAGGGGGGSTGAPPLALPATGALLVVDPSQGVTSAVASGVVRVSAVASPVGALSVAQATSSKRPALVPGALNGWPALVSTAARSDCLEVTDASLNVADPVLVAVCRVTVYGGYSYVAIVPDAAPTYARWGLWASTSTGSDFRVDDTIDAAVAIRTDNGRDWSTWAMIVYRPSTREIRVDGLLVRTGAPHGAVTYPSPPYPLQVCAAEGAFAWLGVYDGAVALSGTTLAAWAPGVEGHLAQRFGLQIRPT